MKNKDYFHIPENAPVCSGTGLVALDVVVNGDNKLPKMWAGGSCGNVLAILAYLGWHSYPIARLGKNVSTDYIKNDLKNFSVDLTYVEASDNGSTPIIVEKIRKTTAGLPAHSFLWTCPECGSWLPRYKSILVKTAKNIIEKFSNPQVFYFDRVNPGAIILAHAYQKRGALIVFEPSGVKDERLFRDALAVSHIVKYSSERLGHLQNVSEIIGPLLQIETLGGEGLRYKLKSGSEYSKWLYLPAFQIEDLKDAAGSGDWCSAGIIHYLGQNGATNIEKISKKNIKEAIIFGQALAALNCKFEGARGGMYTLKKSDFINAVMEIICGKNTENNFKELITEKDRHFIRCICPGCQRTNNN